MDLFVVNIHACEETYSFIPFKDITKAIAVLVLSSYGIYQLMRMRSEECKVQILTDKFNVNHNEALQIETFYSDAEDQLLSMEKQSKELQKRYKKADNMSNQRKELYKLKEDIEFVQSAWIAQYGSFALMEIDPLVTSMISDREVTDKLAEIRKLFVPMISRVLDVLIQENWTP